MARNDLEYLRMKASNSSFAEMQNLAFEIQTKFNRPIDICKAGNITISSSMVDNTAMSMLPEPSKTRKPISTYGDGNCLFNAASIAICGNATMATELRLRTSIELLLNPAFYSSHPVIEEANITSHSGIPWPNESIYDAVIFSNRASGVLYSCNFNAAVQQEILNTIRPGEYSGLLQIMGLASAVCCDIKMFFPDKRHKLLTLLNGTYKPRIQPTEKKTQPKMFIMWTDTRGWPDRSKEFHANHFVPLLMTTDDLPWTTVQRRKTYDASDTKRRNPWSPSSTHTKKQCQTPNPPSSHFNQSNAAAGTKKSPITKQSPAKAHTSQSGQGTTNSNSTTQPKQSPTKQSPHTKSTSQSPSKPHTSQSGQATTTSNSTTQPKQSPTKQSPHTNSTSQSPSKPHTSQSGQATTTSNSTTQPKQSPTKQSPHTNSTSQSPSKPHTSQSGQATTTSNSTTQPKQSPTKQSPHTNNTSQSPSKAGNKRQATSAQYNNSGSEIKRPSPNVHTSQLNKESYPGHASVSARVYPESPSVLPLSGMQPSFYKRRGELFYKNSNRNNSTVTVKQGTLHYRCSKIQGTVNSNIAILKGKLKTCNSNQLSTLKGTLAVANYLIQHGPLIPTQELVNVYKEHKKSSSQRRMMSSELFNLLAKQLNVMQVNIRGQAFICESTNSDFAPIITFINKQIESQENINSTVEDAIGDCFQEALKYMDTKRDRDTAVALLERITSVKFVSQKLLGVTKKSRVQNCRDSFVPNLNKHRNIKHTSQVVRNDMTNRQQRYLGLRIANKRKLKEILHINPGRGRILKCVENPQLVPLLEYAFMECDRGGLQSHPRLTTDTLYRTPDCNIDMQKARELVVAMADPDFKISLSSCYNYTQNYKKNTFQARRHHDGKGINACISFHRPPRIGVAKFVINLHWSSSNVNYLVDEAAKHQSSYFIDSKDAKSIVPGDITPVQKPMKTWRQKSAILPDHDWEQGRSNAVTPMAHLFMETLYPEKLVLPLSSSHSGISVTRSGQAINLVYLSYYEPETVFRQLNEILFLMIQPSLDKYFRNPNTGKIKDNFTFIVDNGPSEQPSSSMVQMSLVRLSKFLKVDRIMQVAFAEYNSKRNFVERVHPQVNKALSDHGPFCSHRKYPDETCPGKKEHRENIEDMACSVIECLKSVKFGGKYADIYRGLKQEQWVFNDESNMREFLTLSESNKEMSDLSYSANPNQLLTSLHDIWGLEKDFKGLLWEDYQTLTGEDSEKPVAWCDKYTTVIYRNDENWIGNNKERYHRQPLPDFIRWLESGGELHYLPYELRSTLLEGPWDAVQGCFLPNHVLDLAYVLISQPSGTVLRCLALLSWTTEEEVLKYYDEKEKDLKNELKDNFKRDQWRRHSLFLKAKEELVKMCKERGIEVFGKKHELVERIALDKGEEIPGEVKAFAGEMLPTSTKTLGKMPISYLRSILQWHGFATCGKKDNVLLKVVLIANKRQYLCFRRERKMLLDLISMTEKLIIEEKKQRLVEKSPIYRHRTFKTPTEQQLSSTRPRYNASMQSDRPGKTLISVDGITLDNVKDVLQGLSEYCFVSEKLKGNPAETEPILSDNMMDIADSNLKNFLECGARVKVYWNKEECKETGWHEGWYLAVIKEVLDRDVGEVRISYVVEPTVDYEINVPALLDESKLNKHEGSELEQFYEIGAKVKVKWTREEIGDSNWRPGWFVAEVQESDPDNDEITLMFSAEPEATYTYEVMPCIARGSLQMVKPIF